MRRISEPRARRGARNVASLLTRAGRARRGVALLAAAALLCFPGRAAAAESAAAPAPSGQVTAADGLRVDGSPALAGQTLFPGSTFEADDGSRPALGLDNLARLELSGGASLRLDFSASGVAGLLGAGGARVYAPDGVAASLTTADASVASDAGAGPALFSVLVSEAGTTLSVQAGRVEMSAGGRALTAEAGQTLSAAHGSAPAPAPAPRQGNNLSGRKKAGLVLGIAGALAAVLVIIAGLDDDEKVPGVDCPIPSVISPIFPLPPGC
jgi:hypothetical protein